MTSYVWTGARQGRPESGTIEADTALAARKKLEASGLRLDSLEARPAPAKRRAPRPRTSLLELAVFTRQMATMINAGIPLLECLEVMAEQADDVGFRHALNAIVESVRTGNDLSEALAAHPKIFKRIYINMVRAGEVSGQIDIILDRLAGYLEATAKLRGEIRSAMTYPIISLVLVSGIAIFLMVFVVPQFKEIFNQLGAELPAPTRLVMAVSDSLGAQWYWWLGAMGAFVISYFWLRRRIWGRRWTDRLWMRSPVFGPLFTKVALARFSRTFSTLLSSGVPILAALEIVGATCGNLPLEEAVLEARDSVQEGNELAPPLAKSGLIPPMVTRMIQIGEKTGALETLLDKVADFYDAQVESAVKTMTAMIEPIMISVMGVMVGAIVMAIFLPIFMISKHLS